MGFGVIFSRFHKDFQTEISTLQSDISESTSDISPNTTESCGVQSGICSLKARSVSCKAGSALLKVLLDRSVFIWKMLSHSYMAKDKCQPDIYVLNLCQPDSSLSPAAASLSSLGRGWVVSKLALVSLELC